jgi:glutamine---fructose-6-phosphate transaminase (isomerizing)
MCGIVGAIAERDVIDILMTGLKRLEYRGYDSAGVAMLTDGHQLKLVRAQGKVAALETALKKESVHGHLGIAHTRWATHGKPAEHNAHPQCSHHEIAVVHNGIVENHTRLRQELLDAGYEFSSETDTEVIAHLVHYHLSKASSFLQAVKNTVDALEGAFALGVLNIKEPNHLIAVRQGSPLVIGLGKGENYMASDCLALLPVTQDFIFLDEGDIADVSLNAVAIYDRDLNPVERETHISQIKEDATSKGKYRHYMLKEIFEQPSAINETIEGRLSSQHVFENAFGLEAKTLFEKAENIQIIACGTSYHAGCVAKYWLESIAKVPCQVEVASEFRYRDPVIVPNTLVVTISQSGETADTLAALRALKKEKNVLSTLVICNVPESSLMRESDLAFLTRAGTEVGVASTKAFTTQLVALLMLTISIAKHHGLDAETEATMANEIKTLPRLMESVLERSGDIKKLAKLFTDKKHALFLGRGVEFPIALEGALKLKEISYIHAEGYPAGELKHGPLALVDEEMPVVTIVPDDALIDKLKSNIEEVRARGGQIIAFVDQNAAINNPDIVEVLMPSCAPLIAPIIFTLPLQLLAYYVAVLKGTDVDQPRNLAKSVTVE